MTKEKKQEIISFIKDRTSIIINENTIFFDDLGLVGLDAYSFMEEFSCYFKIDMTGYNPNKFHRNEADIMNFPKMFFNEIFRKKTNELHYFTTNHLFNVVDKVVWFDTNEVFE